MEQLNEIKTMQPTLKQERCPFTMNEEVLLFPERAIALKDHW